MEPEAVIDITKEALFVLLKVSLPLLLVALVVGSLVSLVQALTQIQEPTLTFVPKLVVLMFTMLIMIPYIGHVMSSFFERISSLIINLG
ncbi:MAG: flagellar biosynthetic protein FliQ [Candidatus Midichloria sp.]|uniref:Flagellar biosynthesis protein FliQ n=1 Tax=Hyalomma marginatum TaxID=34627 RepID=A0A8S4C422_9ACAR|nr:flagellar biosynthesis protein FliQ [Hyalomma marginatum]CAG7594454.1 flagellar biosynthesis protein FliQ [Hyalomma marginatum]